MNARNRKALLTGLEALTLALDPDTAQAKRDWTERERERLADDRARRRGEGRGSGWRRGQPQCPACRTFLPAPGALCPSCRTYNGNHSHTY